MPIYNWYEQWKPGEAPPAILAIGDSWFWYPKNNLIDGIARLPQLKDDFRNAVRLGENGALLADFVDLPGREGRFSKQLNRQLTTDAMNYFSVLLVSGGGNDAVDYKLALKKDCSKETTPAGCIDPAGMGILIKQLTQSMGLLLHEVYTAYQQRGRPAPLTFLHGYDYAVPDGRKFDFLGLVRSGPWLKPAMDECKVDPDLTFRTAIVRILIDNVADAFKAFEKPDSGLHFIDCRGTLNSGPGFKQDWDNELHPTGAGFSKILRQHWLPALQRTGLAQDWGSPRLAGAAALPAPPLAMDRGKNG